MRPMTSTSPEHFRLLLGRFASGVTVATTLDECGVAAGMTATAVAAVSLEPPLLLVCVNHDDRFFEVLTQAAAFAINVLAHDQEALSRQFAGEAADRFRNVRYHEGPLGMPLLEGSLAHIVCDRWSAVPAGDHTVFIGRVVDGRVFDRPPLLHFRGDYTTPCEHRAP